jgi:hypothetical protein
MKEYVYIFKKILKLINNSRGKYKGNIVSVVLYVINNHVYLHKGLF